MEFDVNDEDGWLNMCRWLTGHRKRIHMTQRELAAKMDVSRSKVARLEAGRGDPYMSTIARWLHALGLTREFRIYPATDPYAKYRRG